MIVTLEGVPAETVSVRARTLLSGVPGEKLVLPAEQTRFVVRIPEPQRGDLALDFKALSRGGCTLAVGLLTVALGAGLYPTQERRLVLSPLVAPMCTLTVQILGGEGSLASEPAGLRCAGVGTCSAEFATGSTVRLVPTFDGTTEYLDWGGACVGSAGCDVPMDGHRQVQLTFAPRICQPDGACWHSPLPQGRQLTAVSVEDDHTVLAAGGAGTLLQYTGGRCTLHATTSTAALLSVVRSTDGMIWAASGALQRCSGGPCTSVSVPGSVQHLWATRSGEVWGAGASGSLVRCSGATCSRIESSTTSPLLAIAGSSSDELWVVGQQGTVRRCSGAACAIVPSGTTAGLTSVWLDSDGTAWAAGASGTVLRCRDSRCEVTASGGTQALNTISGSGSGSDSGSVFAAGPLGQLLRCTAAGCEPLATATTSPLNSLWVGGDGQAWVVGDDGVVLRCGAGGCTAVASRTRSSQPGCLAITSGTTADLFSVSVNSSGDAWVTGSGGVVLKCLSNRTACTLLKPGTTAALYKLAAAADGTLWAVGELRTSSTATGTIVRCSADRCDVAATFAGSVLSGVAVGPGGTVWAVGQDSIAGRGLVVQCNKGAPCAIRSQAKLPSLNRVWAGSRGEAWIATAEGSLLRMAP